MVSEVVSAYLKASADKPSAAWIADMAEDVVAWWGDMTLAEVRGETCREYVNWRMSQPIRRYTKSVSRYVSRSTARHELSVLRAAINHYNREHGPLTAVPVVTLPPETSPRQDFAWSREDAAKRLRAARWSPKTRHLVRLILIGLYTGSRPGAILKLRWLPSTHGGWVDVDKGVIHRRALKAEITGKRQPPCRIHTRLLLALRRWKAADETWGLTHVVHYQGSPVLKVRRAWARCALLCGMSDTPHVLRHTSVTWFMQMGFDVAVIGGFLGMTTKVLSDVYAHHHPRWQEDIAQATPKKPVNRRGT